MSIPTLDQATQVILEVALVQCQNNRTHVAKLLGVSLRTVRNYMIKYNLRASYPPPPPFNGKRPKKAVTE